ncbi:ankyrin repeat domain-containing protein [archaeon]|nr:MAG: ankyrin repeat domain-containing protein [archaeon]
MLLRIPAVQEDIDYQDSQGRSALMLAAGVGALDVTAILLNAGAERSLKDNKGMTAYDLASKHSYTVMFKFSAQLMIR